MKPRSWRMYVFALALAGCVGLALFACDGLLVRLGGM